MELQRTPENPNFSYIARIGASMLTFLSENAIWPLKLTKFSPYTDMYCDIH